MTADRETRAARAKAILDESHAVISGDHFVYIMGEHGGGWIDKDAIFPPHRARRVLVVDDVVNTGESLRETADAVRGRAAT